MTEGERTRRDFLKITGAAGLGGVATFGLSTDPRAQNLAGPLRLYTSSVFGREKDLKPFEQKHAVKVDFTAWTSNVTTVTKMLTGGTKLWDVVMIIDMFTYPLMKRKIFEPLDMGMIPNTAHLWPRFVKPSYSMYENVQYGLPFIWGYDAILYNKARIPNVESWKDLFDEKYKGLIGIRDDPQIGIPAAALAVGISDPFALGPDELKEVRSFLIAKKPLVRKLWGGFTEGMTLMRSGELQIMTAWLPMWRTLKREGMNVEYAIPKEKAFGWSQVYVVPRESNVKQTAYKFMDYVLDTEYAASVGRDLGYFSASKKVLNGLTDAEIKELRYDRVDEIQQQLIFGEFPVNFQEWIDTWSAFKAA